MLICHSSILLSVEVFCLFFVALVVLFVSCNSSLYIGYKSFVRIFWIWCFLYKSFACFFIASVVLFVSFKSCLYILDTNPLSQYFEYDAFCITLLPVFSLHHFYLWVLRVVYIFWIQIVCQNILKFFLVYGSILQFLNGVFGWAEVLNFDKVLIYLF